jgi:uncharacterized protein (TIGR00369 family)
MGEELLNMIKNEVENKGVDERIFHSMLTMLDNAPALRTLGSKAVYLGYGEVGLKMTAGKEYDNYRGVLHGGIVAALADTAAGFAVQSLGIRCVTIELNLNYCLPAVTQTEIFAEGYVIHQGRSTVVAEAALYNSSGKLICKSRGTFFPLPVKPIAAPQTGNP